MNDMISRAETAAMLRCSVNTIPHYVKNGLLPEPIRIGKRQWWDRTVVEHIAKVGTNRNWKKESNNG